MTAAFGVHGAEPRRLREYWLDAGYWWNRGLIQHYETRADGFSRPVRTDGRFDGVSEDSPLNPTTVTTYDAPALYVTSVTRLGSVNDPASGEVRQIALTATVVNDQQAAQPARITDPSGTATELAYSPLGMVTATALLGTIEGLPAGDLPLDTRTPTPAPTLTAITGDPAAFLQGSTSYFHYDLLSWAAQRRPVAVIEVTRQRHVHQLAEDEEGLLPVTVAYRDGSGRDVETRLARGPEAVDGPDRWAVSGRVRLDAKGSPVESYLPFFAASPDYGDDTPLDGPLPPPERQRYDALGRPTLTTTSKGFPAARGLRGLGQSRAGTKTTPSWRSPFYKTFRPPPVTPEEKRRPPPWPKPCATSTRRPAPSSIRPDSRREAWRPISARSRRKPWPRRWKASRSAARVLGLAGGRRLSRARRPGSRPPGRRRGCSPTIRAARPTSPPSTERSPGQR